MIAKKVAQKLKQSQVSFPRLEMITDKSTIDQFVQYVGLKRAQEFDMLLEKADERFDSQPGNDLDKEGDFYFPIENVKDLSKYLNYWLPKMLGPLDLRPIHIYR